MEDSLPLCIVDDKILIDLHVSGLLREFFRLAESSFPGWLDLAAKSRLWSGCLRLLVANLRCCR
jgi:hypothetical protein